MKQGCYSIPSLLLVLLVFQPAIAWSTDQASGPAPKNIIVMIGDGFGYNQVEAGRCHQYGETGGPSYLDFDQFAMSTFPAGASGYSPVQAWGDFDHVRGGATDSAAAATALATGVKTQNGTVGRDAEGNVVPNATEKAEEAGRSSGVVTSVMFADATPAAFVAHAPKRSHREQIVQQVILGSRLDVMMGCGHPYHDKNGVRTATAENFANVGGKDLWEKLCAGTVGGDADGDGDDDPWTLIDARESFQALREGPTPNRVLGVAPNRTTLQLERSGEPDAPAFTDPFIPHMPTLLEMTQAAVNILDENPAGFFLMVEGGAIDWAGHGNVSGRLIEEVSAFNDAIEWVVQWIETNGGWDQNLLIVTADHETGYLTGPGSDPEWKPIVCNGAGKMPEMEWHSPQHTNSLVPFFVKGSGSELFGHLADETDPIRGAYLDNTEVGRTLLDIASRPFLP